jgi:hypothetical protein
MKAANAGEICRPPTSASRSGPVIETAPRPLERLVQANARVASLRDDVRQRRIDEDLDDDIGIAPVDPATVFSDGEAAD